MNLSDTIDQGTEFNEAVVQALIAGGVEPFRIKRDVDMWPPKKAVAPILVLPEKSKVVAVFLPKTSWRERWKQTDRDAMLIEQQYKTTLNNQALQCRIIALHHREYNRPNWSRAHDVAEVQKKALLFSTAISDAYNTSQQNDLDLLFADIAGY